MFTLSVLSLSQRFKQIESLNITELPAQGNKRICKNQGLHIPPVSAPLAAIQNSSHPLPKIVPHSCDFCDST